MKTLTITSTTRRTGNETDAVICKATYNNIHITATYNLLTGDLLIDKWYMLPDTELSALRDTLTNHFKQVSA